MPGSCACAGRWPPFRAVDAPPPVATAIARVEHGSHSTPGDGLGPAVWRMGRGSGVGRSVSKDVRQATITAVVPDACLDCPRRHGALVLIPYIPLPKVLVNCWSVGWPRRGLARSSVAADARRHTGLRALGRPSRAISSWLPTLWFHLPAVVGQPLEGVRRSGSW